MTAFRARSTAAFAASALGLALLAGLVGCAEAPAPLPTPSGGVGEPGPGATPSASAEPPAPGQARPLDLTCAQLIGADAVFAFNPNFAALDGWSPEAGSPGATALASAGLACRWVGESGGATIDAAAARPAADELSALTAAAAAGSPVPYGDEAYFALEGDRGVLTILVGDAWLVIASQYFAEGGDAGPLAEAAIAALS